MQIEFELLMMLTPALIFTIAGFIIEDYKSSIILKVISSALWFVMALSHVASSPSFLAYAFAFLGIGIIMAISAFSDVLGLLQSNKVEKELWWQT